MKKTTVLLVFICLNIFLYAQKKRPAIRMYSVNIFTRTIASVPCNEFMKTFQGHMDTTVCYSQDSLDAIDAFLKRFRYSKSSEDIDARIKFEYLNKYGKVTNICMDMFKMSLNGQTIQDYPD